MTNEEIQRHIEQNCRNAHGEPMMDEQAFYEGAKWMRDKALSLGGVVGRSEQLVCHYEQKRLHVNDGKCAKCNNYEHNHNAN